MNTARTGLRADRTRTVTAPLHRWDDLGDSGSNASYAARVSAGADSSELGRYMADCRTLVNDEIRRLFDHRLEHHEVLYDLILDYPLRGGKALRPALSIATCLGLGGHLEAILPTAATLELYHNAFLIHDDIEDESLVAARQPTLHIDHGIPIAVNVGDAMLPLSLQPLLDNVERVGLGPALRILRAVAHMTRRAVEGQALELDWVRPTPGSSTTPTTSRWSS